MLKKINLPKQFPPLKKNPKLQLVQDVLDVEVQLAQLIEQA